MGRFVDKLSNGDQIFNLGDIIDSLLGNHDFMRRIREFEITEILKKMNINKAVGPDSTLPMFKKFLEMWG